MAGVERLEWEKLLAQAVAQGASDIHLAPDAAAFFRVCGDIAEGGAGATAQELTALLSKWTTP